MGSRVRKRRSRRMAGELRFIFQISCGSPTTTKSFLPVEEWFFKELRKCFLILKLRVHSSSESHSGPQVLCLGHKWKGLSPPG